MALKPGHHSREHSPQPFSAGLTQFPFTLHDGKRKKGEEVRDMTGREERQEKGRKTKQSPGMVHIFGHFC